MKHDDNKIAQILKQHEFAIDRVPEIASLKSSQLANILGDPLDEQGQSLDQDLRFWVRRITKRLRAINDAAVDWNLADTESEKREKLNDYNRALNELGEDLVRLDRGGRIEQYSLHIHRHDGVVQGFQLEVVSHLYTASEGQYSHSTRASHSGLLEPPFDSLSSH